MNRNPFDILGLPVAFEIDAAVLRRKLAELAAIHHPDRFVDPLDQADAAERLSEINQAHRILSDPLSRAQLLISLLGQPGQTDEKALPPMLLMEMMEVREELEEAIASRDQPTLDRLRKFAQDKQAEHLDQLTTWLNQALAAPAEGRQPFLQQAQLQLNTLRYFARMLEQMP